MTKIIVDDTLRARLHNLEELIELCDADGRTLALVQPIANGGVDLSTVFTDEEIEEAQKQTGGRTLAEIWKSLGQS